MQCFSISTQAVISPRDSWDFAGNDTLILVDMCWEKELRKFSVAGEDD